MKKKKGSGKKSDDTDFLEGFNFESAISGEITGPEAFVPMTQLDSNKKIDIQNLEPLETQTSFERVTTISSNIVKRETEQPNSTENLRNKEVYADDTSSSDILRKSYGNDKNESTEILLKSNGKPTDINHGKPTDEYYKNSKPTEKPTETMTENLRNKEVYADDTSSSDILRKSYGNDKNESTEILLKSNGKPTDIKRKFERSSKKNDDNATNLKNIASSSSPQNLIGLVGYQRAAFFYIAKQSKKYGSNDSLQNRLSPHINGSILATEINKPYKQAKDIVYELTVKKYLQKLPSKSGPAGYSEFIIPKALYQEWLHLEDFENHIDVISALQRKTYGRSTDKPTENSTDQSPSMYVGNLNNNTIHTEPTKQSNTQTEDPWADLYEVELNILAQWNIRSNVIETFKKNKWEISRVHLEEFIERFVRYFSEKEFEKRREPIKNPYSFFLSSVKAISKGEPDPICDIKTQFQIAQELAMQNRMKELERRRREYEVIEKQLEQYLESEYSHWSSQLSTEEKISIAPTNNIAKLGSVAHNLILKNHFVHNIWPEIKNGLIKSPTNENHDEGMEMSR